MSRRSFIAGALAVIAIAALLRLVWLESDPPVVGDVGIVWHDEGAWVHNARNRALWGVWRTDDWNPVFVAPVFTALEYGVFAVAGVGTWQARVVPALSGLVAVAALMIGLARLAGRTGALAGGLLLATNYAFVMWNRAALMESTMTAWMVVAWAAYSWSDRRAPWGAAAGVAAVLAWFTKAASAFFIAALLLDIAWTLFIARRNLTGPPPDHTGERHPSARAWWTMAGLAVAAGAIGLVFVLPNFAEYRFYNWQMSVTRKPEYSIQALADRASWLPVVHALFSQMWLPALAGLAAVAAIAGRWWHAKPGERLLVLWMLVGLLELVVHDSGNSRRYVMFIPALVALATLVACAPGALPDDIVRAPWRTRLLAVPLLLLLAYVASGTLVRGAFLDEIAAGDLRWPVRLSAILALLLTAAVLWRWTTLARRLGGRVLPAWAVIVAVAVSVGWSGAAIVRWASHRGEKNRDASEAVGRVLSDGTLVQGKLANGLALENRIKPLFVGNGFGNFEDRLRRDDARYILTYDLPEIGYESSQGSGLIQGILDHYPRRAVIATFEVDETPGPDRAVLFDKFSHRDPEHARD